MVGRIKLVGLIAAFLVIFFPSFILAQDVNFSVLPAVVKIDNLPPGEAAEFELTIHNKDDIARNFTFTASEPPEGEMREERARLPDDSWISFPSSEIEVPANSEANVTVTVAIPREQKWAGEVWEAWLGVASESSDLLAVKFYVRLLVSTSGARYSIGLFAGIAAGIVLLGCGGYYYFKRKARPK